MAKGKGSKRTMPAPVAAKAKGKAPSVIEITDLNPKYCTYRNPANMRYVEATETRDGKILREGLFLLTNDHIARLKA